MLWWPVRWTFTNTLEQVHIRKIKLLKAPKFDLGALLAKHGEKGGAEDTGTKVGQDYKEPEIQQSV